MNCERRSQQSLRLERRPGGSVSQSQRARKSLACKCKTSDSGFAPGCLTCTKKPYSRVGMFLQCPPAWDEKNNSISCLVVICAGALAAGTATVWGVKGRQSKASWESCTGATETEKRKHFISFQLSIWLKCTKVAFRLNRIEIRFLLQSDFQGRLSKLFLASVSDGMRLRSDTRQVAIATTSGRRRGPAWRGVCDVPSAALEASHDLELLSPHTLMNQ